MQCHTDPSLIGGAVLQAGDLVIDGSLRSQLNKITYELTA
jgi:F-type H+-transporting ATPase subunit delta